MEFPAGHEDILSSQILFRTSYMSSSDHDVCRHKNYFIMNYRKWVKAIKNKLFNICVTLL